MFKIHKVLLLLVVMPFSFLKGMEEERPNKRQRTEPQRSRIGRLTGNEPVFQTAKTYLSEIESLSLQQQFLFIFSSSDFNAHWSLKCKMNKYLAVDEINNRLDFNLNIFHRACMVGDTQKVQTLINYGADINTPVNITENTSTRRAISIEQVKGLHLAAMCGNKDIVELLLNKGASINETDAQLMTPLHHALANKHIKTANLLLKRGARTFEKDKYENTVYDYALMAGDQDLIKHIGGSMPDDQGRNFLHRAVIANNYKLVHSLLFREVEVDKKDKQGKTALHFACEKKNKELVKLLLAFKASLFRLPIDFRRSLVRQGDDNIEIIKLLLDASNVGIAALCVRVEDFQCLYNMNSHKTLSYILHSPGAGGMLMAAIEGPYEYAHKLIEYCITINPQLVFVINGDGKAVLLTDAFRFQRWDILFLLLKKGVRDNDVMENHSDWLPALVETKDQELINTLAAESEEIAQALALNSIP